MPSAAKAEIGGFCICAKEMVPLCQSLIAMGWPQPRSPIQCDNSTAVGVTNQTIIPRKMKSMDMQFNWLCCRDLQGQFHYSWAPGATNLDDYSTKNHSPTTYPSGKSARLQTASQCAARASSRLHRQPKFSCFTKFTTRVCRSPGYSPGVPSFSSVLLHTFPSYSRVKTRS